MSCHLHGLADGSEGLHFSAFDLNSSLQLNTLEYSFWRLEERLNSLHNATIFSNKTFLMFRLLMYV